VTIDVAANDNDPDGNLNLASINTTCGSCSAPANGSLVSQGNGSFEYTPDPSFTGSDGFVYEICDTGSLCDTAVVDISVNSFAPQSIEVRVASSLDDAEEKSSGGIRLTSSDLELVFDGGDQTVGMRFNGVSIPQGTVVTNAYIQFQVDEVSSGDTLLNVQGEDVDQASEFSSNSLDISSRPRTTAEAAWAPVPWTVVGAAGPDQQTPDLAAIIQEIVDRPGWASGNSLVIIITGSGERVAEAYDGVPAAAPLLHVEFFGGN
jgi:hypothetical protein